MADSEGRSSQADDATQPLAGDHPTRTPADRTDHNDDTDTDTDDDERISLKEAKKLRTEAAGLRRRLQQAESKVQAATDAEKGELTKAIERAEKAERVAEERAAEVRAERAERTVRDAAAEAGARPDRLRAVWRLVKDDVETGDDGSVSNVAVLVAQAKKDSPEYFRPASGRADGGARDESPPRDDMNATIRAAAKRGRL